MASKKRPNKLVDSYKGFGKQIAHYWKCYGGFGSLLTSPFLHLSIAITICFKDAWLSQESMWWTDVTSVIPNMLGFTLGGYAIWLAIGDDKFRQLLSGEDEDGTPSPFMELNSAFVHFIVVQVIALLYAFGAHAFSGSTNVYSFSHIDCEILKGILEPVANHGFAFVGYLLFIYALFTALAVTLQIMNYSRWYDQYVTHSRNGQDEDQDLN